MKVHSIRLDGDIPVSLLRSEVEKLLALQQMGGLSIRLARTPRDFLDASNFLHGMSPDGSPSVGSSGSILPMVERHVLLPGFRKILIHASGRLVSVVSLSPRGVLPIPVEAFLSLESVDVAEFPKIESWIEVANSRLTTEAEALLMALAVFEVVMVRDRRTRVALVFSEEPKCLVNLLGRLGMPSAVRKVGGGPVWVVIPPGTTALDDCLHPLRARVVDDLFSETRSVEPLSFETLEGVVRFRPAILETLSESKRKEIAALYPRDKAYQFLFSPQFLETLKHAERFVVSFPAKITWSNGFGVSGVALDISESGIRFRSESGPVPQDAVREVLMMLQVDAIQSIQLDAVIKRVSPDGAECGLWVNASSVQFKYLVDWIRRSPFAQKTKS